LTAYLAEIANTRRMEPGDDLVSRLVAVEEQGGTLSQAELLSLCELLLVAGHLTTINLLGSAVLALLQATLSFPRTSPPAPAACGAPSSRYGRPAASQG
jgi:cytochrome P450